MRERSRCRKNRSQRKTERFETKRPDHLDSPEIVAKADIFALRIQSRQIHHDKLRGGAVCVFDRKAQARPGDIALIRPARVDYALLCSYIIRSGARIFEPIDPRSPHHALIAQDIQAVATAVAVIRAI